MIKLVRFIAICALGVAVATSSSAWAQTYTTIDFPGAVLTELAGGPNPQGTSVGSYQDTSGVFHGFSLSSHGVFTSFDPPGSTFTVANYITPEGMIVGQFNDSSSMSHGFLLYRGQYTTFNVTGAPGTVLTGENPSGELVGYACSDPACGTTGNPTTNQSFVVSKKGVITSFDPPGAVSDTASTVNPSGTVVGSYTDSSGVTHGYQLYHGTFTTDDFPGSIFTFNGGNNPQGDIVGAYTDSSNVTHSFLLRQGVYTSFDPPGATFSDASGINPSGVIVGVYADSGGAVHGYIRTP